MSENRPDRREAASIISDLLASALMRGHDEGRRDLYAWEQRGLAWLEHHFRDDSPEGVNAWTYDRVIAWKERTPVLPGWHVPSAPTD